MKCAQDVTILPQYLLWGFEFSDEDLNQSNSTCFIPHEIQLHSELKGKSHFEHYVGSLGRASAMIREPHSYLYRDV